jgi:4-hydroxy-tetrahydrodipicolinate synthase
MLTIQELGGLGVALATPFTASGELDAAGFRRLVRKVAEGGADFLVVLGSTGEGPTVLPEERDELIRAAREEAGGLPVVVGTGHNSTREAARLSARAAELGADALLVVTPYYNKPQPAGLAAHYRAVAEAAPGKAIIAYNVPGRTGLNLKPADLDLLWENDAVVAVKESSGNLAQIGEMARRLPPGKALISGDDALALPSIALGARGLISVAANVAPAATKALVAAALAGRREEAIGLQRLLLPLMDALFLESNPAPLKAALELEGICSGALRLPLVPVGAENRARIAAALEAFHAACATGRQGGTR